MSGALIIGYGNPLRQDDGIGCLAAEKLSSEFSSLALQQLAPELAEQISEAKSVIFIDASRELPPGEIRIDELDSAAAGSPGLITHHVSPTGLLSAARVLYGRAPRAWQVAMGGGKWDLGDDFSLEVQRAFPVLLDRIRALAADV